MYEIKLILQDKSFVREIESLSEEKKKSLFLRHCKIILTDFSSLYIKEIWKDDQILKYSYYWFSANNNLILGWDNAPHHNKVNSFPHHKHTENGVQPSAEKILPDIIEYISRIFQP
jgi:hypothetical protein